MIRKKIKKDLAQAVKKAGEKATDVQLEQPSNPKHGDYSSNWALARFPETSGFKSPLKLAKEIKENLPSKKYIEKIEVVKPGFINFHLSSRFFLENIKKVLEEKSNYGSSNLGKKEKAVIEFGQPNTHKLPHIGHFRSYSLGESLARLLEFSNFNVYRANYQGDVGLFVAKAIWGWKNKYDKTNTKKLSLKEKVDLLQKAYVYGSKNFKEDKKAGEEIKGINKRIYAKKGKEYKLWKKTRKWSLDYYREMNKRLGTTYHKEYFESQTAKKGKEIVLKNSENIFQKSQGAVIFPGEKHGLHNRVFLTSAGLPTYEAKDLALIFLKKKDFDYDLSFISTAVEQKEYFKVVYKAAEKIAPELAEKFIHIPFGLVTVKGKKISSRKGNILSIDKLLKTTEKALISLMKEKDYPRKRIQDIKEKLVIGASKYSVLKTTPEKNVDINLEESVKFEGNSGPYLQYTHARAKSILRKEGRKSSSFDLTYKPNEEEIALAKSIHRFPEIVERSVKEYDPSLICNHLFSLAQKFNSFYEKHSVLKSKEKTKKTRTALVKASAQTIKNGLYLLGIEAPEKM